MVEGPWKPTPEISGTQAAKRREKHNRRYRKVQRRVSEKMTAALADCATLALLMDHDWLYRVATAGDGALTWTERYVMEAFTKLAWDKMPPEYARPDDTLIQRFLAAAQGAIGPPLHGRGPAWQVTLSLPTLGKQDTALFLPNAKAIPESRRTRKRRRHRTGKASGTSARGPDAKTGAGDASPE